MRKIIYTSGLDLPYWRLVEGRFTAYAEKCGAELVNLPKRLGDNPQWVIFDAMRDSLAANGDVSALWVDADIVIASYARDLFGYDRLMVCQPEVPKKVHPKWVAAVASGKWGVPNMRPYPVTGLMAWTPGRVLRLVDWFDSGVAAGRFPGRGSMTSDWWGDQELLALAAWELELPLFYFPPKVHSMLVERRVEFGHAAGGTNRPELKKSPRIRSFVRAVERWEVIGE